MSQVTLGKRQIYVLSRPGFDVNAFVEFLNSEGLLWRRSANASQAEDLVEAAGRICYMSFGNAQSPKTNAQYIEHLIKSGHESVLEHISWTLLITGVSRALTHQLVRHRVGTAFSQLSQQYHDESEASFVVPPEIESDPELVKEWRCQVSASLNVYKGLLAFISGRQPNGAPILGREELRSMRSAARSVLPNATETKIVVSANARALRHIIKTRGTIPGDVEMRIVMSEILRLVKADAPAVFWDLAVVLQPDGWPMVVQESTELNTGT